jgi:hypothetical protein
MNHDVRAIRRSKSDPMICQSAKQIRSVNRMTHQSLIFSLKSLRTFLLIVFLFLTSIFTSISVLYSYSHMPIRRALPDIVFDRWPDFALLRSSTLVIKFPLSFIVTLILLIGCLYYTFECFSVCNIRKHIVLFCFAFLFRCVVLFVTQLPPPCHGFPNCSCGRIPFTELRNQHSIGLIGLVYIVTFGFGLPGIPVCGSVLMSGTVTLQIIFGLYLIDTMKLIVSQDKVNAAKFTIFILIVISSLYSILLRSEYTLGVILSVVFVLFETWLYTIGQTMCDALWGPFVTTRLGRLFVWIEKEIEEPEDDIEI